MNSGTYTFKKPLNTMEEKKDWSFSDENGMINVPEHLDALINKIGTQLRFHTISGKNEVHTVVDMVWIAERYFKDINADLLDACQAILNPDKIHPDIAKEMVRIAVEKATKK
jgi:hypothetical protein